MGQQQAPAALRSKSRLAQGHMHPHAAQSNGAQESHHGGHTSEHWQPLCVTLAPRCANCTLQGHTPGDFGDRPNRQELGEPWSQFGRQLCLMPCLHFEWHTLHLAFTLLPWQGCARGPAGSLGTEPGAEISFLLPTECSAQCLLSSHHRPLPSQAPQSCRRRLRFGSTHPQPRCDSLHSIQTIKPLLPRLAALAAPLGAR